MNCSSIDRVSLSLSRIELSMIHGVLSGIYNEEMPEMADPRGGILFRAEPSVALNVRTHLYKKRMFFIRNNRCL